VNKELQGKEKKPGSGEAVKDPFIRINRAWCKGCGICIAFCEKKVYESDGYGQPLLTNPEKCNRCMKCVERCPEFAIEVDRLVRNKDRAASQEMEKEQED
jgi:2-oxoglutarate ferredoxin oxidoreductase subunit delta